MNPAKANPGEALEAASELYARRVERAREEAAAGRTVVGFVGADVPRELIVAAGAIPLRLHSRPGFASGDAKDLLGEAIDPVAHSILGQILAGELDFLAGIAFSRDSSASLQQFYVARQLASRRPSLPPVHLVDLLHLRRESSLEYDRREVHRFAKTLSNWTGREVSAETLREAMRGCSELRERLGKAQKLRREGRLTGSQSLHLFAAAESLHPRDALKLVNRALLEQADTAEIDGLRVFFSGSGQDTDTIYACLEALGAHIVGEDHDWGQLRLTVSCDPSASDHVEGLLDELARAYHRSGPAAATSAMAERARWTVDQARFAGVGMVLCFTRAFDDAPAWDYPPQRELLAEADIPSVLLSRQPADGSPQQLERALAPFLERTTAGQL
ncbi:2-hydroxyacyl-CoA dehydratase family protein [Sinomonas sp. ASV486]|uniref:2-hydroxyacyl-CoA dehydratase subunit D n=1 Tax=Sinomonas sp. ASV486 TaxID=3051170 RepID=UPI0027DB753B|nr:2-hydroxyacyl-CoA dehydratase family protein [Sinomonas sp. ASV486]MDQ4488971.1 2-hydroxyacyl-CoA dehydratase family protein [Sinomonas sp. ASV486]